MLLLHSWHLFSREQAVGSPGVPREETASCLVGRRRVFSYGVFLCESLERKEIYTPEKPALTVPSPLKLWLVNDQIATSENLLLPCCLFHLPIGRGKQTQISFLFSPPGDQWTLSLSNMLNTKTQAVESWCFYVSSCAEYRRWLGTMDVSVTSDQYSFFKNLFSKQYAIIEYYIF